MKTVVRHIYEEEICENNLTLKNYNSKNRAREGIKNGICISFFKNLYSKYVCIYK